jgi:hypothetical protein
MHYLFPARSRAYLLDCLAHLAVPAALVPVGLVVQRRAGGPDRRLVRALSAIPPVAGTLLAAAAESRTGTWGHRAQGLTVLSSDGRVPSFRRALLRNAVKVGAPWQLGHVVALGAAEGGFERRDPWTITATAVRYPWLAAAVGRGRRRSGAGSARPCRRHPRGRLRLVTRGARPVEVRRFLGAGPGRPRGEGQVVAGWTASQSIRSSSLRWTDSELSRCRNASSTLLTMVESFRL